MARIAPGPRGIALARVVRAMLADPLPVLDQLRRDFGDVVELRGPGLRLVILHHPADIEQLLVGHARATSKGPTLQRMARGMGRNLFTLEGEAHEQRRRLLTPIFRPRDIAPHARWAREQAAAHGGAWRDGEPVDVGASMDALVLAAMGHVVLGRPHGTDAQRLSRLVHESVDVTPRLLDPAFPLLDRLVPRYGHGIDSIVRRWDALCDELIERARREPPPDDAPMDVLHRLLAGHESGEAMLDDPQALREELRGLLLAAHETTSLALAWTLHQLARHPDVLERLLAEVDATCGDGPVTAEHVPALRFTRAAFDETLRTHGGTFIPRGATQPLHLDHAGIDVPAGTELLASMWTVHRDARFWPEPEAWRPERFLEPEPDRPRFAWFPFGGGRRTCIGMHLALQSGVVVLAELARRWRVEPLPDDPPVRPMSNVLVRPTRPIMVVPRARSRSG
jgi:cytochrome P450